ncbi:MAG: DUF4936 family protein [Betaproteobacteria bacterium]
MAVRGPTHVYVYYRVVRDTAGARAAIGAMLTEIERRTGVAGRLLARRDDPQTWLEIYEPVTRVAAFERALATAVAVHDAASVAEDGRRHVERFAALPARRGRR